MARYEVPYAEAERLRINGNRPADFRRAIELYQQYIRQGGSHTRTAHHMIGVCYQRLHAYEEAINCYLAALDGASDYERGNIERDMAASYGELGEYELAEISLATSLGLLPYDLYPAEHAACLGFWARLQLARGRVTEAVEMFADADSKLHAGPSRHMELYNKLHYASALSRSGRGWSARRVALACLKLSLAKDPATGRRYGSRQHHKRALSLLVGGHRLESYPKALGS